MVAPFLVPILATLASNGLNTLVGAISAKGKEFIEDKIGIKIPDNPAQLTPELIVELKKAEMQHEQFLVNINIREKELYLDELKVEVDNTKNARDMNKAIQESDNALYLAKVAPYYLDFLIIGSTLLMAAFLFFMGIPTANEKLAYMALGSLITMCGTILNFHRGTSSSSARKSELINSMTKV